MDFRKVIIMTDLDGTLLTTDKRILPEDMAAIDEFRAGGGKFTIATGRGISMAKSVAERLRLDMPCVLFNGAAVYDYAAEKFIWHCSITRKAVEHIKRLMTAFPDIGIEILHEKTVYVTACNQTVIEHMALEHITPVYCTPDEVPESGWLKVLIAYPPPEIHKIIEFTKTNCTEGVNWVHSSPMYYEMLPEGISKAAGFKKLIELTGCADRMSAAIGDFGNDRDMVRDADFGVAVANAKDEVKAVAKLVVCDNDSGALAEMIEHIRKM